MLITTAIPVKRAEDIEVGDIIPGIGGTRHRVTHVTPRLNKILGECTWIETEEIYPDGQAGLTSNTELRKGDRIHVEA